MLDSHDSLRVQSDGTSDRPDSVRVSNAELATVREAMRELNRMVEALERAELEKVVLTQRNRIRAVVLSLARYTELADQAATPASTARST